jgi:hypothetical protein
VKHITRAAALLVAAAVLAITTHGSGSAEAAVWCAKHVGQDTNGTCPIPPPASM